MIQCLFLIHTGDRDQGNRDYDNQSWQQGPHRQQPQQDGGICMCVRDIESTYFYDFFIECWNCSDSVIYILFILS